MADQEVEARLALFRAAPRHVKLAARYATLAGLITILRMCATAYAGHLSYGKALLFGCVVFVLFWWNGMSLLGRSRWGYIIVAALAVIPLLGVFAAAVHLLRLLVEGTAISEPGAALIGVTGFAQLVVACFLLRHLLAGETRHYVWEKKA